MDEVTVTHYGLHEQNGVAYLHQGRNSFNFLGLRQRSPFIVKPYKKLPCNHLINPASPIPDPVHWKHFLKIAQDPLVQTMFPIPKQPGTGVLFVNDPSVQLATKLILLGKMSTPIQHVVRPIFAVTPNWIKDQLETTNVQPLVLVGAIPKDQRQINELVKLAEFTPRRLIITGEENIICSGGLKRAETDLFYVDIDDLANLPFDLIGAMLLRRHARNEELLAPLSEKNK